jgi:hypothetical protein
VKRKERLIVERTATADAEAASAPSETAVPAMDACFPDTAGLLDGLPRQRGAASPTLESTRTEAPATRSRLRPWRLLPTPNGTSFTFAYAAVLTVTSLLTTYADPALVHTLHQGSSTDVAHLMQTPVLVLPASALWIAGGILSPYAIGFLLVLTALERRIGGLRTAGVFLLGHVLATLATEVPIGLGPVRRIMPETRGLARRSAALSSVADSPTLDFSPTLGFARAGGPP